MEENEFEIDNQSNPESDASKTHLVVLGLAVIGGATVAKKAFNKVRGYRIVRKSKLAPVTEMPTPEQA